MTWVKNTATAENAKHAGKTKGKNPAFQVRCAVRFELDPSVQPSRLIAAGRNSGTIQPSELSRRPVIVMHSQV